MTYSSSILQQVEVNPASFAKSMNEWMERDPVTFCQEALPAVHKLPGDRARHIFWMMSVSKALPRILCESSLLHQEAALGLIEQLNKVDVHVETNLFHEVFGPDGRGGLSIGEPLWGLRLLSLIEAKGGNTRLISLLHRLLGHPNAIIRSKAAAIIGKYTPPFTWIEQQTRSESDYRVRANGLEALWRPGIPQQMRALLWDAVADPSNRVAGNALLGLYRQGDSTCIPAIASMAMHPQERFRATAAWVISETGDERFRQYLLPLLEDASPMVQRNAAQALTKLERGADVSKLEHIELLMLSSGRGTVIRRTSLLYGDSGQELNGNGEDIPARVFRLAAVSRDSQAISGLLPTDFCIRRNSALVEAYTVQTEVPPEMVSIAFVIPAADTGKQKKWQSFFERFFRQKRHLDYWAIVEYSETAPAPNQISAAVKPMFVRNSVELEGFLTRQNKNRPTTTLASALNALVTPALSLRRGLPPSRHALHIMIVESPAGPNIALEQVPALKRAAIENNVCVHLVSTNESSTLAECAAGTGGAIVQSQANIESLQRQLQKLYASLFSVYRIHIEATAADDDEKTEIDIKARNPSLFGQIRISSAHPDETRRA